MANCNECLHGDVCERFTDNVAIICKRFKHDNDYAEVKHGEWIEKIIPLDWCDDDVDMIYECSICKAECPFTSKFCPNCGAKMGKKEGAEECT